MMVGVLSLVMVVKLRAACIAIGRRRVADRKVLQLQTKGHRRRSIDDRECVIVDRQGETHGGRSAEDPQEIDLSLHDRDANAFVFGGCVAVDIELGIRPGAIVAAEGGSGAGDERAVDVVDLDVQVAVAGKARPAAGDGRNLLEEGLEIHRSGHRRFEPIEILIRGEAENRCLAPDQSSDRR